MGEQLDPVSEEVLILTRRLMARQMAQRVDGLTVPMAGAALEAAIDIMSHALIQGGEVRLSGFGTFWVSHRCARTTRHPRTGAPVQVPAARIPMFRPSAQLRQRIQPDNSSRSKDP
jgi:nucleoid DNA-binding protein